MADFLLRQTADSFAFVPQSDKARAWVRKAAQFEDVSTYDDSLVRNREVAAGFKALLIQSGLTVEDATDLDKVAEVKLSVMDSPIANTIYVVFLLCVMFGVAIYSLNACSDQRAVVAAEQKQKDDADAVEQAAKKEENKRKGFNCLSAWDGSEPDVVNLVKARLRDPGSFEHIDTQITLKDAKGLHHVMMRYRSRNGFGGMIEGTALATVLNLSDRCVAQLVALDG